MKSITGINKQTGAVSLFVVVFAMLLMSVVTVSFLRIMTNDQNQASANDLAQSAYDSAQAGVEDAKRALVWYMQACTTGTALECSSAETSVSSDTCNKAIEDANHWSGAGEIKVQSSTSETGQEIDEALNQAYTCVTMELDTPDYVATIPADQSVLIPLIGKDGFTRIRVEWYSSADLSSPSAQAAPSTEATPLGLPPQADWPQNRPPVLRTQFMQVGSEFTLGQFDSTDSGKSNANTVFLYPSTSGFTSTSFTSRDVRANPSGNSIPSSPGSAPLPASCTEDIPSGGYACRITLTLPNPVDAADRSGATAFLRLTSLYTATHARVLLTGTDFKGVQPVVDSTGRANDVFRRVESRIDLYDTSSFPYPDAAVDVSGNLCKDFGVTDTNYYAGNCTP